MNRFFCELLQLIWYFWFTLYLVGGRFPAKGKPPRSQGNIKGWFNHPQILQHSPLLNLFVFKSLPRLFANIHKIGRNWQGMYVLWTATFGWSLVLPSGGGKVAALVGSRGKPMFPRWGTLLQIDPWNELGMHPSSYPRWERSSKSTHGREGMIFVHLLHNKLFQITAFLCIEHFFRSINEDNDNGEISISFLYS